MEKLVKVTAALTFAAGGVFGGIYYNHANNPTTYEYVPISKEDADAVYRTYNFGDETIYDVNSKGALNISKFKVIDGYIKSVEYDETNEVYYELSDLDDHDIEWQEKQFDFSYTYSSATYRQKDKNTDLYNCLTISNDQLYYSIADTGEFNVNCELMDPTEFYRSTVPLDVADFDIRRDYFFTTNSRKATSEYNTAGDFSMLSVHHDLIAEDLFVDQKVEDVVARARQLETGEYTLENYRNVTAEFG